MKLLLVGGGGREHALAWKLTQDDPTLDLIAAPGNPGIASLGRCVSLKVTDIPALLALARAEAVDLTVVGPEAPLAAAIVDRFREAGRVIFGPTAAAAEIESSKAFAKQLMIDAGVPTARAERHTDPAAARRSARDFGAPVVIKASGLAAGKGVVVCWSMDDADASIDAMLLHSRLGSAGAEILVEEYMEGEELSIFAITDGTSVLPMLPVQDHKRLRDGDLGPNTGGMGAYAPVSIATATLLRQCTSEIFDPTLAALRDRERPFTGLLYAGLMLTRAGVRVVEFNCRFGDPETEAILPLLASSLLEPITAVARGDPIGRARLDWRSDCSVVTVVAAAGYPEAARTGDRIDLPASMPEGVHLFHAGTLRTPGGDLLTAGGRVLAVTGVAASLRDAQALSVSAANSIGLEGKQLRTDIAWRDLARHARASGN
ncbi:MAG: phosphoribosylamine--glycine ligase [Gemmatimonadota bacterium]|nr:phosphoribosylamine--glycine ligase [Gemmatimonadota bacterium]